jgi:hypothetical protein
VSPSDATLTRHLPVATCIGCGARSHSAEVRDGEPRPERLTRSQRIRRRSRCQSTTSPTRNSDVATRVARRCATPRSPSPSASGGCADLRTSLGVKGWRVQVLSSRRRDRAGSPEGRRRSIRTVTCQSMALSGSFRRRGPRRRGPGTAAARARERQEGDPAVTQRQECHPAVIRRRATTGARARRRAVTRHCRRCRSDRWFEQ